LVRCQLWFLLANTWYYLAATYDGETLNTYKNGVLVTSNTAPSGPPTLESNPLAIAKHAAENQFFQGIVDNVRIYSRALSQTEIQNDMNTAVGANPVPVLTTLVPSSGTAGGAAFTLTVNGSNFVSGATVRWNGAARTPRL